MVEKEKFNPSKYKQDFAKKKYKRIPLDVPVNLAKEIDDYIKVTGEPRNTFIKRAIIEAMKKN